MQVAALPERIRPDIVAFGSLADGFFPLTPPTSAVTNAGPANSNNSAATHGGTSADKLHIQQYSIKTASVVMKAVQARAAKINVTQVRPG